MNILCSWSGGKDACYSLALAINKGYTPIGLVNVMNENAEVSRSHGLRRDILEAQAAAMGLPLFKVPASWEKYEELFTNNLHKIKKSLRVEGVVFGDIDIQIHKEWEEKVCQKVDLKALLPLWNRSRKELLLEMIDFGIEALIVSCNEVLGPTFLGRKVDRSLIKDLESLGVDVCGENGEYHTVVYNCPLFTHPIELPPSRQAIHEGYCFLVWG